MSSSADSAENSLPLYIQSLLNGLAKQSGAKVQLVQTHISYVLLAGDKVYKFKKPVDFGFLDFSTLEKRQFYCEQELVLNRRLCPSIYLHGVQVCSTGDDFTLSLSQEGDAVEYGICMQRMPEEGMMSKIIARGELQEEHLDAIVAKLVPFYKTAADTPEIKAFGKADAVGVNVLENFTQTEGFVGQGALLTEQFAQISTYAKEMLAQESLFEARIKEGKIRDCHGDLYSANVCFADEVQIFDCIEFNERFRYTDVAADIGFMAMDLDFHGLDDLAEYFVATYIRESGDTSLPSVLNFYKCYRAYVRGKIGLFTAADPAVDDAVKKQCLADAGQYFSLAQRYAR